MKRTSRARVAAVLIALASLAACGGHSQNEAGSDAGAAAVEGSINGVSLTRAYAVAAADNSNATGGPTNEYTTLAIGIANKALDCTTAGLPKATFIGISIKRQGSVPIGLGSYRINTDQTSSLNNNAALITTDSTCAETSPASVIGGTVTITDVTAASLSGTFTLAFNSGEAMHGTFNAVICATIPPSLHGASC